MSLDTKTQERVIDIFKDSGYNLAFGPRKEKNGGYIDRYNRTAYIVNDDVTFNNVSIRINDDYKKVDIKTTVIATCLHEFGHVVQYNTMLCYEAFGKHSNEAYAFNEITTQYATQIAAEKLGLEIDVYGSQCYIQNWYLSLEHGHSQIDIDEFNQQIVDTANTLSNYLVSAFTGVFN